MESIIIGVRDVVSKLEEDGIEVILVVFGSWVDIDEMEVIILNKVNFVKINDIVFLIECVEEIF